MKRVLFIASCALLAAACIANTHSDKLDEGCTELACNAETSVSFEQLAATPPEGASDVFVQLASQLSVATTRKELSNSMHAAEKNKHPAMLGCGATGCGINVGNGTVMKVSIDRAFDPGYATLNQQSYKLDGLRQRGFQSVKFVAPILTLQLSNGDLVAAAFMEYAAGQNGFEFARAVAERTSLTSGTIEGIIAQHFDEVVNPIVGDFVRTAFENGTLEFPYYRVDDDEDGDYFNGDVYPDNYNVAEGDVIAGAILNVGDKAELYMSNRLLNLGRARSCVPAVSFFDRRRFAKVIVDGGDELLTLDDSMLRARFQHVPFDHEQGNLRACVTQALEAAYRRLPQKDLRLERLMRDHAVIIDP